MNISSKAQWQPFASHSAYSFRIASGIGTANETVCKEMFGVKGDPRTIKHARLPGMSEEVFGYMYGCSEHLMSRRGQRVHYGVLKNERKANKAGVLKGGQAIKLFNGDLTISKRRVDTSTEILRFDNEYDLKDVKAIMGSCFGAGAMNNAPTMKQAEAGNDTTLLGPHDSVRLLTCLPSYNSIEPRPTSRRTAYLEALANEEVNSRPIQRPRRRRGRGLEPTPRVKKARLSDFGVDFKYSRRGLVGTMIISIFYDSIGSQDYRVKQVQSEFGVAPAQAAAAAVTDDDDTAGSDDEEPAVAPPAVIPPAVAPLRVVVGAEFRIPGQRYIYTVTRVSGNPPQAWYCPSHMDRQVERNWRGPWQDLNALSGMIDEMDNASL